MKNLLKILSFGAILIVLIGILSVVFNGGDLAARGSVIYYDRRIAELSNEQEGQIDITPVRRCRNQLRHITASRKR